MGSGSQIAGTRSRRASSANTQASIRSVLQANGARPFTFCASAISTCQPASSSRSCTNRAPFIDSIAARIGSRCPIESSRQAEQAVGIRRCGTNLDGRALTAKQMEVETLATEIQTGVQHRNGPPLDSSQSTSRSVSPGRPFFMAFLTRPLIATGCNHGAP
jgi:hypothetical protein